MTREKTNVSDLLTTRLGELRSLFGSAISAALGVEFKDLEAFDGGAPPTNTVARRILDLSYVVGYTLLVMDRREARAWFLEPEVLLGNRVPINVLREHGISEVLSAIVGIGAGILF
jgi:hypothetical protein